MKSIETANAAGGSHIDMTLQQSRLDQDSNTAYQPIKIEIEDGSPKKNNQGARKIKI